MPPTCTVYIEEVYIRTMGRAIFAILYAPAGTVNMQRLVDQFSPRWTPYSGTLEVHRNEVTECQERGEGTILGRIAWLDITETDAVEMIREESGHGEELQDCVGHVFDISHNVLSFVDMIVISVEPISKQQVRHAKTDAYTKQTYRDILSVGCRNLLRDFRAGLNTGHHNFHIICALGYIPHNSNFNQECNQQVRKLCATSKQLYVIFISAHTSHHHYKFLNSKGHELQMAIVRPEFTRRNAPLGLEGLPLERRNAMDRFVRTAVPHINRKLLPEAESLMHILAHPSPAPVSFNMVIEAPTNNNDSMIMCSAVSSYRPKDTAGASGETTQVYDGRLYAQTKNRHSMLGDRFETEIRKCFDEYPTNCTEILCDKYGAEGTTIHERLQWVTQKSEYGLDSRTADRHEWYIKNDSGDI